MMSRNMKDSYIALSLDETNENVPLHPDTEKEEAPIVNHHTRREYRGLIKHLLIILILFVLFAITATIIITITAAGSNNTRCPTIEPPAPTPPNPIPASTIPQPHHTQPQPATISSLQPKDCGKDPTTARARGCHFDIMSMIWIPQECYNASLTASFAAEREWEWARHENGTDRISRAEILTGNIAKGWVRFEYHLTHCLYTWKKVVWQVERGGPPVDGYVSDHRHTSHCARALALRDVPAESWNTPFVVLYPTCFV